jgi:small GTP-binding protein
MIEGSRTLLKYPNELILTDSQMRQINKLLDITFEKSFFYHQFDFSNSANYYLEVPSKWARGGKESILISILLDSTENPENWQEPIKEFTDQLERIPDIYKSFSYLTTRIDPDIKIKFQELQELTKHFYESIPETHVIQRIVKLFMFGLDRVGKTSISKRISENLFEKTSPTLWLSVHNFQFQNFQFVCFDVGGQKQFRGFWRNYLDNSEILIFVIDGTEKARFPEAKKELWGILEICEKKLPLLVLNNKADVIEHIDNKFLENELALTQLNQPWHIIATSAKSGLGMNETLNWITEQIIRR